jgi:hypothetical protein
MDDVRTSTFSKRLLAGLRFSTIPIFKRRSHGICVDAGEVGREPASGSRNSSIFKLTRLLNFLRAV